MSLDLSNAENKIPSPDQARHHRTAMEQRRTVQITLFVAVTTLQVALTSLAVSQAGKPTMENTGRFCIFTSLLLAVLYVATVIRLEVLNRNNAKTYLPYENPGFSELSRWNNLLTAWATWPVGVVLAVEGALVMFVRSLPGT